MALMVSRVPGPSRGVGGAGGSQGSAGAVPGRPDALFPQMSGDKGISAFPESDNLFKWIGTIDGAAGTVSSRDPGSTLVLPGWRVVSVLSPCFLSSPPLLRPPPPSGDPPAPWFPWGCPAPPGCGPRP